MVVETGGWEAVGRGVRRAVQAGLSSPGSARRCFWAVDFGGLAPSSPAGLVGEGKLSLVTGGSS